MNKKIYFDEEDKIKKLLIEHSVKKINEDEILLDNGIKLNIVPNQGGCCCGAGDYEITELNECSNIITNVEFVTIDESYSTNYKIFVYAEDKKINLLTVSGDDGSGYYGTGYSIIVKGLNQIDKE